MAEAGYWMRGRSNKPIPTPYPAPPAAAEVIKPVKLSLCRTSKCKIRASSSPSSSSSPERIDEYPPPLPLKKKTSRGGKGSKSSPQQRLIKISTADGKWHGKWKAEYTFSLRDLQLEDLAEDDVGDTQAPVSITLCFDKHAGFGLSVDGRIVTSFTRKCINCFSPYCREIDTNFNVWVLPSSGENQATQLPEIGGDDPSVIYVKPGSETDFDSLIKDTIRLTTSVEETCSELCEKSEPSFQHLTKENAASIDKRWSRLLELRNGRP